MWLEMCSCTDLKLLTLLQICAAFIHLFIFPLLILVGLKCSGNRLRW